MEEEQIQIDLASYRVADFDPSKKWAGKWKASVRVFILRGREMEPKPFTCHDIPFNTREEADKIRAIGLCNTYDDDIKRHLRLTE